MKTLIRFTIAAAAIMAADCALADGLRPFQPGEKRLNSDGTFSTEISATSQDNSGAWFNFPTLYMSESGPIEFTDSDIARDIALAYEHKAHCHFPRFATLQAAESAAVARSQNEGALHSALCQ